MTSNGSEVIVVKTVPEDTVSPGGLPPDLVELTPASLSFTRDPTRQEWDAVIKTLLQLRHSIGFWIGDAILHGENTWGSTYTQAIEATGRTYSTLASYVRVCRAVPPELRQDGLVFEYHKRVALSWLTDDQKARYLERAAAGEFENSTELGDVIKQEQGRVKSEVYDTLVCPVCFEREIKVKEAHGVTCGHCKTPLDEIVIKYNALQRENDDLLLEVQELERRLQEHE